MQRSGPSIMCQSKAKQARKGNLTGHQRLRSGKQPLLMTRLRRGNPCCIGLKDAVHVHQSCFLWRLRQIQSYRERTHKGYACVERSMGEGIERQTGHW
eukprot:271754-Chlamydomonas_euryale.AAC.5